MSIDAECGAEDNGWLCNLEPGHDGSHAVIVTTGHGDDCDHAWDDRQPVWLTDLKERRDSDNHK